MSSTKPTTRERVLKFRPHVNSSVFMNYKSHRLSLRRGNVYQNDSCLLVKKRPMKMTVDSNPAVASKV